MGIKVDIKAASLYWHFKSKQQIFLVLAEEVAKRILSAFQDNGDWKEQLFRLGVNIRKQLQAFPCSAQLLMQTMPTAPDYVSLLERMLSIIEAQPLSDKDKFSSISSFMNYILVSELDAYERNKVRQAALGVTFYTSEEKKIALIKGLISANPELYPLSYLMQPDFELIEDK